MLIKKTNLSAYFPQSVAFLQEQSSEKNNLSNPTASWLGPPVFQFLKACFFLNSNRSNTQRLFFFAHPIHGEKRRDGTRVRSSLLLHSPVCVPARFGFFSTPFKFNEGKSNLSVLLR